MAYQVKEIFYTLQGEGAQAGRAAVFCRFAGCNLWSGREEDRARAKCTFCDTDFVGTDGDSGGTYRSARPLAETIERTWTGAAGRYVVFTGGEPLLQLDTELIAEVRQRGFELAIETNGTLPAPPGIDWITVSPKADCDLVQRRGNELKLVYPQKLSPEAFADLDFSHFYLSPLWSDDAGKRVQNQRLALNYCIQHTQWKLTMQHHKFWGIP